MKKQMILNWMAATCLTLCPAIANAESTLILDLQEQYNEQLSAMQSIAKQGQHKMGVSEEGRELAKDIQKLPKDSTDRRYKVGEYVALRLDELGAKYEVVNDLKSINLAMYETLDRLVSQLKKSVKKSESISTKETRLIVKKSKQTLAGAAKMMAILTNDRVFSEAKPSARVNQIIRNINSQLNRLTRNKSNMSGKADHLEQVRDELEAQGVLLSQAEDAISQRINRLDYINSEVRSQGILRHTDKVLASIGIIKLFENNEEDSIDRIVEDSVIGGGVSYQSSEANVDFASTYSKIKNPINQ